jgi:hypothetical protein
MPNRIDTAEQRVENAAFETALKRASAHPHRQELPPGNHAVLLFRQGGNGSIEPMRAHFSPLTGVN